MSSSSVLRGGYGLNVGAELELQRMARELGTTPEEALRRSLVLMREALKSEAVEFVRGGEKVLVKLK